MESPRSGDGRQEAIFVGRDNELGELLENIRSGTHTLIVGERGIGKSALLRKALQVATGELPMIDHAPRVRDRLAGRLVRQPAVVPVVFIVMTASPLAECLRELAHRLWQKRLLLLPEGLESEVSWDVVRKWYASTGKPAQVELIRTSLARVGRPNLVAFDSLDRLTPGHQMFLEGLFELTTVLAAATKLNDALHYKNIWSSFGKLELGPLPGPAAQDLVEHLAATHGLRSADHELFVREVLSSSAGNPFLIRLNVWRMSRHADVGRAEIRSLRRTHEGEYFNMGPIYIFGASIFTLYKILTIGMDNREFYIYFSALGFFVYLSFRVFRNFFLFRPQRKR